MIKLKDKKHVTNHQSMFVVKGKTFYNIVKESILHPLRTSIIDKKTGDVVGKEKGE